MNSKNLPVNSSAVLVWLPKDISPTDADFDPNNILSPPTPNPEAWWYLHEAVRFAATTIERGHGKLPWIKTGNQLLTPGEIAEMNQALGKGKL